MKYKLISIVSLIIALIVCILANYFVLRINPTRVDQHLDSKIEDNCLDDEKNCSHLPIVSIVYEDSAPEVYKYIDSRSNNVSADSTTVNADFKLYYNHKTSNRLTDVPYLTSKLNIKYRGNSSLEFDKHQYLLKFINEDSTEKTVSLLGMNEENKWVLNGPYLDKSLLRNYVAYNIAGKITDSVPEVRYCELYVNGNYQGVYLLIETVSRTLTNITRYKEKWSNGMTSYILRLDRAEEDNVLIKNFGKYTGKITGINEMNIVYPSEDKLTDEIVNYITDDFSEFEKSLYSYEYKDYEKYIDVNSFIDYMLINEFFKNSDAGTHSTYFYKDVRGKIHMGPVWDFNNSANNYVEEIYSHENFLFYDKTWYDMLFKDENFINKTIERYRYLRKGVLSDEYIQNYIDGAVEYLGKSIDRNFEVWGYTFTTENLPKMLKPDSRNYHSYKEALEQYKDFLHNRGIWMDENIETLKQYCHTSVTKGYEGD